MKKLPKRCTKCGEKLVRSKTFIYDPHSTRKKKIHGLVCSRYKEFIEESKEKGEVLAMKASQLIDEIVASGKDLRHVPVPEDVSDLVEHFNNFAELLGTHTVVSAEEVYELSK